MRAGIRDVFYHYSAQNEALKARAIRFHKSCLPSLAVFSTLLLFALSYNRASVLTSFYFRLMPPLEALCCSSIHFGFVRIPRVWGPPLAVISTVFLVVFFALSSLTFRHFTQHQHPFDVPTCRLAAAAGARGAASGSFIAGGAQTGPPSICPP